MFPVKCIVVHFPSSKLMTSSISPVRVHARQSMLGCFLIMIGQVNIPSLTCVKCFCQTLISSDLFNEMRVIFYIYSYSRLFC